jgi:hypothetical protein
LRREVLPREPSSWAVVRIGQAKEWIEVGRSLAVPTAVLRVRTRGYDHAKRKPASRVRGHIVNVHMPCLCLAGLLCCG